MADVDLSILQENLSATLAKVAMMKAQLSSLKNVLASKAREFETIRQENQEAGADEMIAGAMAILRKSTDMDISEMTAAIKKLSKNLPCIQPQPDSDSDLPVPPFTENE